jgi:hypothetical protein
LIKALNLIHFTVSTKMVLGYHPNFHPNRIKLRISSLKVPFKQKS